MTMNNLYIKIVLVGIENSVNFTEVTFHSQKVRKCIANADREGLINSVAMALVC